VKDIQVVESVALKRPDGFGEQASADKEDEVCHCDEEDGQR
jgi:hypothetical protein